MSEIYQTVKERMTLAMKNRDQPRKDIFRFLKGKMDQIHPLTDKAATSLIRGFLKDAKENPGMFSEVEVHEMTDLVPALLDLDQTLGFLTEDAKESIRQAGNPGQAIGIAMKTLAGKPVDSEIVRYIVLKLRENS